MKLGVIIQARMGSTRLPGKVLLPLGGRPALLHVLDRSRAIAEPFGGVVVVATSDLEADRAIVDLADQFGYRWFRGDHEDVLNRFYQTNSAYKFDTIVRITADCPLLDPEVGQRVIRVFLRGQYDYASNVHPPTWPDGLDVEVFTWNALMTAWAHAKGVERLHVTPYLWRRPHKFRIGNLVGAKDLSKHRWTLDTEEDYEFLTKVFDTYPNPTTEQALSMPVTHTLPREIRL